MINKILSYALFILLTTFSTFSFAEEYIDGKSTTEIIIQQQAQLTVLSSNGAVAIAGLNTSISNLNTVVTNNSAAITNLNSTVSSNAVAISNITTVVTNGAVAIAGLNTSISNLNTVVTNNSAAITNLNSTVSSNAVAISNLNTVVTNTFVNDFPLSSAASQNVSVAYTAQFLWVTNTLCKLYMPDPSTIPLTNSLTIKMTVDINTNSLLLAPIYCVTSGVGSVNALILTNSGTSAYMCDLQCAGTNLNRKWRFYGL